MQDFMYGLRRAGCRKRAVCVQFCGSQPVAEPYFFSSFNAIKSRVLAEGIRESFFIIFIGKYAMPKSSASAIKSFTFSITELLSSLS